MEHHKKINATLFADDTLRSSLYGKQIILSADTTRQHTLVLIYCLTHGELWSVTSHDEAGNSTLGIFSLNSKRIHEYDTVNLHLSNPTCTSNPNRIAPGIAPDFRGVQRDSSPLGA